jgi:hypothetical protein
MNDLQTEPEVSVTRLVSGIITDAQKLFAQQWALVRLELKDDLHKSKEAGLFLILGSVIALVGAILLSFMLVELLSWAAPELPSWVRYGIVGAPITALGSGLVFAGIQKFRSIQLLPDQSVQALKETFQWRTNPK